MSKLSLRYGFRRALPGAALLGGFFGGCGPLWADGGCVDSPENPSIVLLAIGALFFFVSKLLPRLRAWRRAGAA